MGFTERKNIKKLRYPEGKKEYNHRICHEELSMRIGKENAPDP